MRLSAPRDQLTFEEWVRWIFDREITESDWYYDDDDECEWLADPVTPREVEYLTRLYREADVLLTPYGGTQILSGLLHFPVYGLEIADEWIRDDAPLSPRRECVLAMKPLFLRFFAHRLPVEWVEDGAENGGDAKIREACFMWWDYYIDEVRIAGRDHEGTRDCIEWFVDVMREQLTSGHAELCLSALHGMGELQKSGLWKARPEIDRWLEATPGLPDCVMKYARCAQTGDVL